MHTGTKYNEKDLIKGLREGKANAYETLFKLFYAKFVGLVTAVIGDKNTAQDLVQEAFMKVWINREKLDENLSIQNYLYVLVKRAMLNLIRDRKFATSLDSKAVQQIMDDTGTQNIVETDDLKEKIIEAVAEMPPQRREVFLMSRSQGLSNKEIADYLNISVRTVERHISLALSDLRSNFHEKTPS